MKTSYKQVRSILLLIYSTYNTNLNAPCKKKKVSGSFYNNTCLSECAYTQDLQDGATSNNVDLCTNDYTYNMPQYNKKNTGLDGTDNTFTLTNQHNVESIGNHSRSIPVTSFYQPLHQNTTHLPTLQKLVNASSPLPYSSSFNKNSASNYTKNNPSHGLSSKAVHHSISYVNTRNDCTSKNTNPGKHIPEASTSVAISMKTNNKPGDVLNTLYPLGVCPVNDTFFYKTVNILKVVLYYRFNIAQFFSIFNKQINKEKVEDKHNEKMMLMKQFIELSLQFAMNNKSNTNQDVIVINESCHKKLKLHEKNLSEMISNNADLELLNNSEDYKAIKYHNKNYLIRIHKKIIRSEFQHLYYFLCFVFTRRDPISKYYNMLSSLLVSLYDISTIIENKIDPSALRYLSESEVFEVHGCDCGLEVKQYFVFHWALCWVSYFSRCCTLPDNFTSTSYTSFIIDCYPKSFFLQFIVLVHLVINFEDKTVTLNDIDANYMYNLKQTIYNLLFSGVNEKMTTIFQNNLQELVKNILNTSNHKIYRYTSVLNVKIIQTPKENFILSNELIPMLTNCVTNIFNLTRESFRQTRNHTLA